MINTIPKSTPPPQITKPATSWNFSPVKVVLKATKAFPAAEVRVHVPVPVSGGELLCSMGQHHFPLAAAYRSRAEVYRQL